MLGCKRFTGNNFVPSNMNMYIKSLTKKYDTSSNFKNKLTKKFEVSEPKVKTAHVQNRTFEKITNKPSLSLKNEIGETIALGLKKIHKACQNKYTPLRDNT